MNTGKLSRAEWQLHRVGFFPVHALLFIWLFADSGHLDSASYQGKSLYEWCLAAKSARNQEERKDVREALRNLVSDSPNSLVSMLCRTDLKWKAEIIDKLNNQSLIGISIPSDRTYRNLAYAAFDLLREWALPTLPGLISALNDENEAARGLAIQAVQCIGHDANKAIPALIELLEDPDQSIRERAAEAVQDFGQSGRSAVPTLSRLIVDQKMDVNSRIAYLSVLEFLDQSASPALPNLIRALNDINPQIRVQTAHVLESLGPTAIQAVESLGSLLNDSDPKVRIAAIKALGEIKHHSDAIASTLIRMLRENDFRILQSVIETLQGIGAVTENLPPILLDLWLANTDQNELSMSIRSYLEKLGTLSVSYLIPHLENQSSPIRRPVSEVLGRIGPEAFQAVSVLKAILNDESQQSFHLDAAEALGGIDSSAEEFRRAFFNAIQSDDALIRHRAIILVDRHREISNSMVEKIAQALTDEDRMVRWMAAKMLGNIGDKAFIAIPQLMKSIHDPESSVRTRSITALGAIGPKAFKAVPELITLLQSPDHEVIGAAIRALLNIGQVSRTAIPRIVDILLDMEALERGEEEARQKRNALGMSRGVVGIRNQYEVCRLNAAKALGEFALSPELAVPALVYVLDDSSSRLRERSANALRKFGKQAEPAIPKLRQLLNDEVKQVRSSASIALYTIEPITDSSIEFLAQAAKKTQENTGRYAVDALGQIGPRAKSAIPVLQELLKTENRSAQLHIQKSIEKIMNNSK